MPASSKITIGGVDYTAYIDMESVRVNNNVVMTYDTMGFDIDLSGELPAPKDGSEVQWLNDVGVREFAGVISQIKETDYGTCLTYTVTAQSFERLFNKHLVIQYIDQMLAGTSIKNIVTNFCKGFTTTNVVDGYVIPPMFFNYVKPTDAIKRIAQQIEFGYYIDYYRDVHFYPIEQFVTPLPNNNLLIDTDTVNYANLELSVDGTQKKTRVYLKGFKSRVSTPMTLNFVADGQTKQWSLGYRPSRATNDVTVTVGNTAMTVKRDFVEGFPDQNVTDTSSAFINYNQLLMRLNYAPSSGTIVKVVMYYLADTVIMRENIDAQDAAGAADGTGDGIYEHAVTEPSLSQATVTAANSRGDMLLWKYSYPTKTGQFTSFTQGWRASQYFNAYSTRRLGGVDQKFYIHQVEKTIVKSDSGGLLIKYVVHFADIPYLAL